MSDYLVKLGLLANTQSLAIPSYAPHFIIGNFVLAYALLSTRGDKMRLGLDHNSCPRLDLVKYGQAAVSAGKITQDQLNQLHRREGAHANAVEHFPFFVGAILFGLHTGLPNVTINRFAALYTVARIAYAYLYIAVTDYRVSYLRSIAWWTSNILCFRLFWAAGKRLNGLG